MSGRWSPRLTATLTSASGIQLASGAVLHRMDPEVGLHQNFCCVHGVAEASVYRVSFLSWADLDLLAMSHSTSLPCLSIATFSDRMT